MDGSQEEQLEAEEAENQRQNAARRAGELGMLQPVRAEQKGQANRRSLNLKHSSQRALSTPMLVGYVEQLQEKIPGTDVHWKRDG